MRRVAWTLAIGLCAVGIMMPRPAAAWVVAGGYGGWHGGYGGWHGGYYGWHAPYYGWRGPVYGGAVIVPPLVLPPPVVYAPPVYAPPAYYAPPPAYYAPPPPYYAAPAPPPPRSAPVRQGVASACYAGPYVCQLPATMAIGSPCGCAAGPAGTYSGEAQ